MTLKFEQRLANVISKLAHYKVKVAKYFFYKWALSERTKKSTPSSQVKLISCIFTISGPTVFLGQYGLSDSITLRKIYSEKDLLWVVNFIG